MPFSYFAGVTAKKGDPPPAYKLWAWGQNNFYQLGLGDTTDRSSPVQLGSLTHWTKMNALTQSMGITS